MRTIVWVTCGLVGCADPLGSTPTDAGHAGDAWTGTVADAPCPSLPGKGQWSNVSPPDSDYTKTYTGINSVVVRPDNPATVFVGADSKGIFRSDDCGATWKLASTGRNADAMSSGRPWSMALDSATPDVMYAVQGYGSAGLWKTTNAGVDWDQVLSKEITDAFYGRGLIDGVAIDPGDHQHLVVQSHGSDATGPCAGKTYLAESTDAGATWKLLTIPTGWGEGSGIAIVNRATWLYCLGFYGLWQTTDQGGTWSQVALPAGQPYCNVYNPYVYQDDTVRALMPSTSDGLLQSAPKTTATWTLLPQTPTGTTLIPTAHHLVLSSQFKPTYWVAAKQDPTTWTALSPPGTDSGAIYLAYDPAHHVLYASTFGGGLWQRVLDDD